MQTRKHAEPATGSLRSPWGFVDGRAGGLGRLSGLQGVKHDQFLLSEIRNLCLPDFIRMRVFPFEHAAAARALGFGVAPGRRRPDQRPRHYSLPGSMVVYPWKQAMVQSFVALGRDCQRVVSICEIQRSGIFYSCMRRGHRRISDVHRLSQRSLGNCRLYFGFFRMLALSLLFDAPECLSRRFAKHFHDVVLRHLLRRMFEENEMVLVACDDGALGQSAWRLFAWFSCCRRFLRHGLAQAGLGKSQNLWLRRSWLLHCNIHQSSWLA